MSNSSQPSLLAHGERVLEGQHAEEAKFLSFERSIAPLNRRNFLGSLGAAGAVAGSLTLTGGLAGCSNGSGQLTPTPVTPPVATGPSVVDVLNFALNLEYLEASFYSYLSTGNGLSATDMGTSPGTVSGGAKVTFANASITSIAAQLAFDEVAHVQFLRTTITAIGGTPVSMPNLNLAAMGAVTDDTTFLTAARQLETVGVSAYAGGAQYLVSNTNAVLYAAQILDTESQHESYLRQLCIASGVTSGAVDSLDIPPTPSAIFNTSPTTGLYTIRTTSQVLQIVYAAPGQTGVAKGGFFPNGLNGTISTT